MKNTLAKLFVASLLVVAATYSTARDVFDLKLSMKVPRIYNNNQSLGYRKYQTQTVNGEMLIDFDKYGSITNVTFRNMVNKTHKMSNGKYVTYDAYIDSDIIYPRFNVIGNNNTGKFTTPSVSFYLAADPAYNIGEMSEDNGLYILMSGYGTLDAKKGNIKTISGTFGGTLGCGCMAYGHVSPTRVLGKYGATD